MSVEKPRLTVVVSGPSGAGKSTLCERYVDTHSLAELVVTTTTRPPRKGEEPGVDYNFASEEEFLRGIERGEFLEYAEVHGHRYGSPRQAVDRAIAAGKDVILEIDVQGGLQVRKRIPDALLIFVTPSDPRALRERLVGRGTDSEAVIARRLANARREMESLPEYNVFLFNDDLDTALGLMASVIEAERHRIERYDLHKLFSPGLLDSALLPRAGA
jgi:guanylate kinase